MAKTGDSGNVGRQAPREVWSAQDLKDALVRGTLEDKVATLRQAGIIDDSGKLAPSFKSWGDRLTRAGDYSPGAPDDKTSKRVKRVARKGSGLISRKKA